MMYIRTTTPLNSWNAIYPMEYTPENVKSPGKLLKVRFVIHSWRVITKLPNSLSICYPKRIFDSPLITPLFPTDFALRIILRIGLFQYLM